MTARSRPKERDEDTCFKVVDESRLDVVDMRFDRLLKKPPNQTLICLILLATLALSRSAPQYHKGNVPPPYDASRSATILRHDNNNIGIGNYDFAYQTSDGISREERAELKNVGSANEALVVQGQYSYVGDDGVTYTVNYIADENGYRAIGSHLPKN
ncbi:hypothetical protein ILUMI_18948 [Ignelater luminosus]|uniref:Uncharacterized protein n=1 Tax=Ignelater luminosus TaxID=2038154 RepID=A0A8K0CH76_IGNLU|nr:hypothetical protein ILUMI_18948 [Ignelater luminosus]